MRPLSVNTSAPAFPLQVVKYSHCWSSNIPIAGHQIFPLQIIKYSHCRSSNLCLRSWTELSVSSDAVNRCQGKAGSGSCRSLCRMQMEQTKLRLLSINTNTCILIAGHQIYVFTAVRSEQTQVKAEVCAKNQVAALFN